MMRLIGTALMVTAIIVLGLDVYSLKQKVKMLDERTFWITLVPTAPVEEYRIVPAPAPRRGEPL